MSSTIKFYKIKLLKNFLENTARERARLLNELITNATDPTVFNRRYRMLTHLNQFEIQIVKKIQEFDTDDINDLDIRVLNYSLSKILNKSA